MYFAHLKNRSLVKVSGEDAKGFLDNILTCNVQSLSKENASFGALLTPQGKILFDFFLIKTTTGYLIDTVSELVPNLIKRLNFYRLRAKVKIHSKPEVKIYALWGDNIQLSDLCFQDPRLKHMGSRDYSGQEPIEKESRVL